LNKFKAHLMQKFGESFVWDEEEQMEKLYMRTPEERAASAAKALIPAPPPPLPGMQAVYQERVAGVIVPHSDLHDKNPLQKFAAVIDKATKLQYSTQELMQFRDAINEAFAPRFHVKPVDVNRCFAVQGRYTVLLGNWREPYCTLCKAYMSGHENSANHKKKVEEMTACDEMIGPCSCDSMRRFSERPGLRGVVSRKGMMHEWGTHVHQMVALVYDRLHSGVRLEAAIPGWGKSKRYIGIDEIMGIGMAAVTYPGCGKYCPGVDVAVRWEDMLEDAPADYGHFEQLIPEDAYKQGFFKAPEGRSWWPVCIASWKSEASDCGWRGSSEEYRIRQQEGFCVVWVLCLYQLWDGTWVLCLWPVYLRSRL